MTVSRPAREPFTQSLLLYAYQTSASGLVQALHRAGHTSIRPKHGAVFANVDRAGTRPSELARRAGMTKAAMGELVDELERLGYVRRVADPTDRRARLVVPTAAAIAVARLVVRVNEREEARYREQLGRRAYATLRRGLRRIAPTGGGRQPRMA
jgi:DNA-binding MarR family transcriptional regulator